jgi:RimJ/RimL family protein N-acetyltransferase
MTDPNFHIATPRLYLSYYQPTLDSHCDHLVNLCNTPEVLKGNGGVATPIPDRETARKQIESSVEQQVKTGYGRYLVSLRLTPTGAETNDSRSFLECLEDCQKIGMVGLKLRNHPEAPSAPDIGFSFLRPFWGKGYATEAATALLDYFDKERGVKEVFGFCNPANEESKKMLQRLGFEERGVHLLKGIGGRTHDDGGVRGLVWAKKGMNKDLSVYGI